HPPFIFLLQADYHPPTPHSFPTRRSSDLFRVRLCDPAELAFPVAVEHNPVDVAGLRTRFPAVGTRGAKTNVGSRAGRVVSIQQRSEEHTSELQSRRDLVCRLLLEKKKRI